MKVHIDIACVHGSKPQVFITYEDIASDPNLTCEVLYQTLRAEQEARGGKLPEILYLQLDNCIRENKNTYLFAYICWLVERNIFKTAYVSFLPVGHTHFDCDRLASRIAFAMKYRDVTAIGDLRSIIEQCNHPAPQVEILNAVADVKGLFNPSDNCNCPVATSRVQRLLGCATKVPPRTLKQREFMSETSPLHWQARKDLEGKVVLQSKLTCDDDQWSAQHYPWTPSAPRPDDRTFEEGSSGLRPSDLKTRKQKPLADTRATELAKSLPHVKSKLSEDDWEAVKDIWDSLVGDTHLEDRPLPHDGLFINEEDDPCLRALAQQQNEAAEDSRLFMRPPSRVFQNTNRQALDREKRKRRGRADGELIVGNLVALTGKYTEDVTRNDQQDFWVAKILQLDHEAEQVHVSYYNTPVLRCLTSHRAKYRAWVGAHSKDWIDTSRVLHTFTEFTPGGLITAFERRKIGFALNLPPDSDAFTTEAEKDTDSDSD